MKYTPRPYQEAATQFALANPRANWHMPPGLGKTAAALDLIKRLNLDSVLIIAPALVVRETWAKEWKKWDEFQSLEIVPLIGTPKQREAFIARPPKYAAINPELLPWLTGALKERWPFGTVIFDESTRLKGYRPTGQRPSGKRGRGTLYPALLAQFAHSSVTRWVNLTGTPVANSYLDLWGPQHFIDQGGSLGKTFTAFKERWFRPVNPYFVHSPWALAGEKAAADIRSRLAPTTYTARPEDYFDLEQPVHIYREVDMPRQAWTAYKEMQSDLRAVIKKEEVTAASAGAMAMKLRQIVSGSVYREEVVEQVHTERMDALASLIEELNGAPLIVVVQFTHELERIRRKFGAVDIHENRAVERWNKKEIPLLVLHAAAAGHGISLHHGGHHICFFSAYSNNELYSQVVERLGPVRQAQAGYKRPVYVHHFVTPGTIDDQTRLIREGRISALDGFMEAMKR